MIKKLVALFAVLTALCVLAIIPLAPFAVRDLANVIIPQYNQMKAVLPAEIFPLDDNITTLSLSVAGNDIVDTICITHNETKEIIVKSNQLSQAQLTVNSSTQGDTISIFLVQSREPFNILSMESPSDIWNKLIQMCVGTAVIEISVPDGLILTDEKGEALLDPKTSVVSAGEPWRPKFEADWNVKYLQKEDILYIETDNTVSQQTEPDFEDRVRVLRGDLLELVQTNARGEYSQLEFNMNLNDCRIRMEALLMEYAEQEGLINYDKYKDQPQESSKATGLSAKRNQAGAADESVDEAEAKAVIRELSGLYLSRLVIQAKLDLMPAESETGEREALEQQIADYTRQIEAEEEKHTEFAAGLMATGLLF